ncbi:sensory neuron membrane protein 1-like [Frankliniella occidentalis]|uniref:Sensory neuron membrane protein 1-like n=1 Tax=Frankliniella occidentalis TaxID=133901 RepID=A0A6J1TLG7_FRAOC|nr:sensory neuron membrane protein 1-like [Frankliniella occidentalis]
MNKGTAKKIMIAGIIIAILSIIVGWFAFPALVSMKISKSVALRKPNDMRQMWSKSPIAIDFKVYMFNVTNPEEAAKGEIPTVTEVGPYYYHEWKEKVNLEDHPEEDTVSFRMKNTFFFNKTISAPLTGDEMITIPHAAMLSMVYTVEREKPGALNLLAKGIKFLFNNPTTPFLTAKARDILFDGVPINCTSKDFATAAICTMIRANPSGLKPVGDDIFLFSFFGMKNATPDATKLEVKRGVTDPQEVGLVVKVNDKEKMTTWSGDPCNTPTGTDSTIFPPFLEQSNDIVAFSTDLCLSIGAKFEKEVVFKGIPGNRYTATLGDMSSDPEMQCYCPAPDKCLKKGIIDLTKCAGAPIAASLPHLYETHEDYQKMVKGLHPDVDKHGINMIFEPMTATPVSARKRLQFNIFTHPVAKIAVMKTFCTALIPIFWIEEGVDLPDDFVNLLETQLFRTLRIAAVGRWIGVGLGCLLALGGLAVYILQRQSVTITPSPTKVQEMNGRH